MIKLDPIRIRAARRGITSVGRAHVLTPEEKAQRDADRATMEDAESTKFDTLIDDISVDPSGRGRVAPVSPLRAAPQPIDQPAADAASAAMQAEAYKRVGKPDPNAPAPAGAPAPAETETEPETEPEPDAALAAAKANRPSYGRVQADPMEEPDPGPAPERDRADSKWAAGIQGLGTFVSMLGGDVKGAQQNADNIVNQYGQDEAARVEYARRAAALRASAAKDARESARYAEGANFDRARAETQDSAAQDAAARAAANDRFSQDITTRDQEYQEWARSPEGRKALSDEALGQYRSQKDIEFEYAQKAAALKRKGSGGGRGRVMQAYQTAKQALANQYGGEDKIPPDRLNELDLAAQSKDAIGAMARLVGGSGKEVRTTAAKAATNEAKLAETKQQAQTTLAELNGLEDAIQAELNAGQRYIPGKEPLLSPDALGERAKRGKASLFGDKTRGSTGFTPAQQRIQSAGKLLGRAAYLRNQGNSANLKAESDLADSDVMNDGTLPGMLKRVREMRAGLQGDIENGRLVLRDADGNRIDFEALSPEDVQ